MRRSAVVACTLLLLLTAAAAQPSGRLVVSVRSAADPTGTAVPAAGAKVIVVHWSNSQMPPALLQNRIATTDQRGVCEIELPPGTYDVFVSANGLAPAAAKREVSAGQTAKLNIVLRPAPMRLRPVQ